MGITPANVDALVALLLNRDELPARDLVASLRDAGISVPVLLTSLVTPALDVIGERWHRNEVTVADEHGATATADAVIGSITAFTGPPPTGPSVIVVCAEGEWHVLAARVVAETLRAAACDVVFLSGSLPAGHFKRFLERWPPDVIAVSSSSPLSLGGVLAAVEVAHEQGIPTIVGGHGLGPDDHRALVLGADMWAADAMEAASVLWNPLPTALATRQAPVGATMEIALQADDVVRAAMAEIVRRLPAADTFTPYQMARLREYFAMGVQFARASILTTDLTVFGEFVEWLGVFFKTRGVPDEMLQLGLQSLADGAAPIPALAAIFEEYAIRD